MPFGTATMGRYVAGEWSSEESDFLRVVASFRAEVPPGLRTFPVTAGSA